MEILDLQAIEALNKQFPAIETWKLKLQIEDLFGVGAIRLLTSHDLVYNVEEIEETTTTEETSLNEPENGSSRTKDQSEVTRKSTHWVHTFPVKNGMLTSQVGRYLTGVTKTIIERAGVKPGQPFYGMKASLNRGSIIWKPYEAEISQKIQGPPQKLPIPNPRQRGITYHDKLDKVTLEVTMEIYDSKLVKLHAGQLIVAKLGEYRIGPKRRGVPTVLEAKVQTR
jgi:hypothetical protein